ncbi:unnamed protein product [Bursaphelenchus okinawaensis]|uniref:Uncharacterized protein n=1 Tax=Bursaphelenchus okinawaensis TaxID=465554 RepID=A0A811LSJ6_9BILA|nr:unnamed protein product [Bursaphelenchus okinawaensis]CAG9127250.1 unnamed protein product [Bursaphelenchus okinawaensis]
MFLIAKIVRGRRLLHELEQAEKEKEKERERDRLEAQRKSIREDSTASTGSSSNSKNEKITGFTHHRRTGTSKEDSDAKKKSVMLVENNENKASTSGENDKEPKLRRRKTWASADAQRAVQSLRNSRKEQNWKRRNSIARASHSMMLDTVLRKAGSADLWYQHSFTHLAHQKAPHRRMIHSFPASVSTVSLRKGVSLDDDFYNRTVKANGAKRGSYDTRIKTSEGYGREVAYGISKGGTYSSTKGGEYGTTKSSLYDTTKRTSYCATKALPYCTNTVSYTKRKSYDTSKSLYDTKPSLYSNPKHSSTEMLPMLQRARQQSSRWSLSMEEAWIKLSRRLTSPCTLPLAMDLSSVCISRSFKKNKPKKRVRREYYLKNVMYNS